MTGRWWIAWILGGLGGVTGRQDPIVGGEKPASRPTVLFWLIDTCRADRTSVGGNPRPTTPFLERLGREGVVFERCFSQASWTKPSMGSILTSRYPSETGASTIGQKLDSSFVTFPEVFQDAGYYTAAFPANPIVSDWMSNYLQGFRWRHRDPIDPIDFASGSSHRLVREHVLPFLDDLEEWPLFLYVHSLDPHEEYEPAPEFLAQFADPAREPEYRRQWQALLDTQLVQVGNSCRQENFERAGVDPAEFLGYGRDLYDADVRACDDAIERLVNRLLEEGDDLVVVVTSDHGEEFFEHGATGHGNSLYNELLHVPLVLWAPGRLPAGLRFGEPVRSLDVYPTVVELAGLEVPEGLSGRSLLPWIRAGKATESRIIHAEQRDDPFFAMLAKDPAQAHRIRLGTSFARIEGPWKFLLNLEPELTGRPRRELYSLPDDPGETRNLAEEHPERAATLEERLLQWIAANHERHLQELPDAAATLDEKTLEALRALGYVR